MLCFCIKDDGIGMTDEEIANLYDQFKSSNENNAIDLKNVYRRLQLIYAKECRFYIESKKNQGVTVSFDIPLERSHEKS